MYCYGIVKMNNKYTKRKSYDSYFTNKELAKRIVEIVDQKIGIDTFDLIIEPSAGNGSFLPYLPAEKTIAYDIDPKHPSIIKQDFLKLDIKTNPVKTLVIGNPPFGRQSLTAFKFLKKSMQLADTVAFILPKACLYLQQRKVRPTFHLIHEQFIKFSQSFYRLDGYPATTTESYCIFQIYLRKECCRPTDIYNTYDFQILPSVNNKDGDIFIQRICMPRGPRLITTCYDDIPLQKSLYNCISIKAKDKSIDQLYSIFTCQWFIQVLDKYSTSISFKSSSPYVLYRAYYEYNNIMKNQL